MSKESVSFFLLQDVVVEVRLGVVGVPVFHPLSLCLEVYLLSTVWFGAHLLLSINCCRL